jgi:hypothetical protein
LVGGYSARFPLKGKNFLVLRSTMTFYQLGRLDIIAPFVETDEGGALRKRKAIVELNKQAGVIRLRRKKCVHCEELFSPDPKSRYHQTFCAAPECKRASKAASQRRWREKLQNRNYWQGPEHVERVRAWRKAKAIQDGKAPRKPKAQSQSVASAKSWTDVNNAVLQDDLLPQDPLIVGVISALAGSSLQDDIVIMYKHLIAKGREILSSAEQIKGRGAPHPALSRQERDEAGSQKGFAGQRKRTRTGL